MGLEDDRGEDLYPVHHQRPMARPADLSGLRISAHALRALARDERRRAIRRAGTDSLQRTRDPARDELVMARRVRALMHTHGALARFARARPGLLARQQLGEAMRRVTVRRDALVALALMAGRAVTAVEANSRTRVPGPRTRDRRRTPALAKRSHTDRRSSYARCRSECTPRCVRGRPLSRRFRPGLRLLIRS